MRIIRFYKRFKTQWRKHKKWASIFTIIKMAWLMTQKYERNRNK